MATLNDNSNSEVKTEDGVITSGSTLSYWLDSVEPIRFQPLSSDLETDVIVIGAGISGITTAYCLAKSGKKVIVIDDGFVGSGETGRTTAHASNALDDRYVQIERYHGSEGAKVAADSHTAAIAFIETTAINEAIDCDFRRLNGYLFLDPSDKKESLEEEFKASHRAGLPTELIEGVPGIGIEIGPCLKFPHQGQFHPLKYLKGLTQALSKMGVQIFTETRASEISEHLVKTENGYQLRGEHIVVATNSPINDLFTMHTKQYPYRTYVIGALIPKGIVEFSLWWDTGAQESKWITQPYHYVRMQSYDDVNDLLICGGEDHKTGQADKEEMTEHDRYSRLEVWLKKRFPATSDVVYRWSGQVMEPLDAMGYIGKNPGNKEIYIITGDSGNGITHGTLAGMLINDLILGRENTWEKLYDPSRITLKVTGDYLKEATNMAAQYGDYLAKGDVESAEDVGIGEGAIISAGLKKYAVYKDSEGITHSYSAVCPHLGCIVQWNSAEKSFDCPCHGSRFTCEGKVINGPASSDLARDSING